MNSPIHFNVAQYPLRVRWIMAVAWLIIIVKCFLVWWAVGYWHMAFHPLWVVAPTIIFAALATGLWLTHREE